MRDRKYSVKYNDEIYNFLLDNAQDYTIKQLVKLLKDNFNFDIEKKKLAQYCIKMGITYKYEHPKKSHSNKPTPVGVIVRKTDGDMLKVKVGEHKWEYLQRKIYEDYYNVKLPQDVYVVFLNQNKRDFNIENLKALSRRNCAIMSTRDLFTHDKKATSTGITISNLMIKLKENDDVSSKN